MRAALENRADGVKVVSQKLSAVAYDEFQQEGLAAGEAFVPELNVICGKLFQVERKRSDMDCIQILGQLSISF